MDQVLRQIGIGAAACIVITNHGMVADGATSPISEEPRIEISLERVATTGFGRDVVVTRLHRTGKSGNGPALLIVGGVDPRHGRSSAVAEGVAAKLAKEGGAALEHGDVFVVNRLNPDGIEGDPKNPQPRRETARKPAAAGTIDADRDGRFNEDPPVDLDGDGRVLWMRVKDPAPGSGLTAEYVAEEGDGRALRKPDRVKGERPLYALLPESRDADGDGLFGEDGFDGVELDRNFPYHWQEYRDEAGRVPLSEPETRGLAEWLAKHENIVGVVVYAMGDNLVNVPPGGKMDENAIQLASSTGVVR
jgi:hypothetical protein